MYKIVTVCGMGIGTSVLLKMNVEKVLRTLGRTANVLAADIESAPNVAADANIILTSPEFEPQLDGLPARLVVISNFFDLAEIETKLADPVGEK